MRFSTIEAGLDDDIVFRVGEPRDLTRLREIDDDAGKLFERAGLTLDLPADHEFVLSERSRWLRCLEAGTTLMATDRHGRDVGFIAIGLLDGLPYLDQLSVRESDVRRGIGGALLLAAIDSLAAGGESVLWLNTYDHLSWNRPFYERRGFHCVPEDQCGPGMRRELAFQRRWLPQPDKRIAMRRRLGEGRVS